MIKSVWNKVNYWYFRYLLVTELYMVEQWERFMIHTVFFLMFAVISVFNWQVVLGLVRILYAPTRDGFVESIMDTGIISGCLFAYMLFVKHKQK